ncbi:DUF4419 domain-containing protein [Kitasatospora sp. NPDC101157]|uniref:DUF4419 domain-containing protein n=1 Tax=Kitasatospora sp. NPDC101157 TaxID=3364098 RepID=UPI00381CD75F
MVVDAVRADAVVVDIGLGDGQEPGAVARLDVVGNDAFLAAVVGGEFTVFHRSTDTLLALPQEEAPRRGAPEPTWSLLLRAAHTAFAEHLPLSLSPDVLWYAVVHEVAVHVRLNAERYEGLFSATPGQKRTVEVRDDSLLSAEADWARSIRLVREPLAEAIGPELVELFQPTFSTTTPDDVSAALVALMDVVSPYYEFLWSSLCGIPKVRLEGTAEDWALLAARVGELADWFEPLGPWFAELRRVLAEIAATAAGGPVDEEFWRSLYKWESESGGDFVSGWITAFFAHTQTGAGPEPRTDFNWRATRRTWKRRTVETGPARFTENAFPSHVSKVPFRWQTPGGVRSMVFLGGVLGIERDGEYVRPRLGNVVLEVVREPVDPAAEQAELAAAQLPEGWTIERVREVSGAEGARLVSTEGIRAVDGLNGAELGRPIALIRFGIGCVSRLDADGPWYVGTMNPRDGVIGCEPGPGPELADVLPGMGW